MLGDLINWLVFSILQFDPDSRLGAGIKFFLYDSLKILLLLFCMVSLIGFLRTFWRKEVLGYQGFFELETVDFLCDLIACIHGLCELRVEAVADIM